MQKQIEKSRKDGERAKIKIEEPKSINEEQRFHFFQILKNAE